MDLFGLEREAKIAQSGVRKIFTPHQPVQSAELFFGRKKVVTKIIEQLNTPGQHVLLYGDRGVGKSSLANVTTKLLIESILEVPLFIKRCSSEDNFLTIFSEALQNEGVEISLKSSTIANNESAKIEASIKVIKLGVGDASNSSHTYEHIPFNPSTVAEILKNKSGLLYIDEADQLKNPRDKVQLAETIKLLSDSASPFKILVVGIAETGEELEKLIEEGSSKIGIKFEYPAIQAIVKLSSGYPHFTHLLALKCCEEVIDHGHQSVTLSVLKTAIRDAVDDAEGALKRVYEQSVRSAQTDMFKTVLLAAARIGSQNEFQASKWRTEIENITAKSISQGELNNYLGRLVSDDDTSIIKRLGKGVYKFNDPRMPSFVKIAAADL